MVSRSVGIGGLLLVEWREGPARLLVMIQRVARRLPFNRHIARRHGQTVHLRQVPPLQPDGQGIASPLSTEAIQRYPAISEDRVGDIGAIALNPFEYGEMLDNPLVEVKDHRPLQLTQLIDCQL